MIRYLYGLIAILLSTMLGYTQPIGTGVSPARYEKLKKGINIDNWLVRNADGVLAGTQFTDADLKLIKQAGFKHVRFPIRSTLMNEQQPEKLNQRDVDSIKSVLNRMLNHGLAVVFNPVHPAREYTARMEMDTALQTKFVRFWTVLAKEFSTYDPETVFIEPINEPFFKNPSTWFAFNERLLKAIRQSAPRHTLIVSPVKGNIDVIDMTPLADKNVVYSTHFYSPFAFTHQGAPWLKNLPLGQHYPSDKWNADYLKTDFFNPLMAWVNKHHVKVYMGEYGVLNTADYADKLAWLTDVGQIVTDLNLAAALWCYNPGLFDSGKPKSASRSAKLR